jgi:hypothetical protein
MIDYAWKQLGKLEGLIIVLLVVEVRGAGPGAVGLLVLFEGKQQRGAGRGAMS